MEPCVFVLINQNHCSNLQANSLLSIEWNSIRLSGPAHRKVTKTVHKTLPGVEGVGGGRVGVVGVGVVGGQGVAG